MAEDTKKISIIEPSHIITEGLTSLLFKTKLNISINKFDNLSDFINSIHFHKTEIAILNPIFLIGKKNELQSISSHSVSIKWLALIYAYFDKKTLNAFDGIIQITDSPEAIFKLISELIEQRHENKSLDIYEQLSEREIDVLIQIVNGLSNKEIADKLNISIHTVISHRKNISQKTGIKSQSGLTIFAISNKIISL